VLDVFVLALAERAGEGIDDEGLLEVHLAQRLDDRRQVRSVEFALCKRDVGSPSFRSEALDRSRRVPIGRVPDRSVKLREGGRADDRRIDDRLRLGEDR
jgi:hypothetical protein